MTIGVPELPKTPERNWKRLVPRLERLGLPSALRGLGPRQNRGERRRRVESFGAIVQLRWPRALVFVDRTFARRLGIQGNDLWGKPEKQMGDRPLSAPLEAHLQITNQCQAGCKGCYTAAHPNPINERDLEAWKRDIDVLADMGVFHLALGGGESADVPWLGELAIYARSRGLVPNLTTSGLSNLSRLLQIAHLFGQINVSMDGLGDTYAQVRGFDGFAAADLALRKLRRRNKNVGINVVVTRHNFSELDTLVAYAKRRKLNEVELLRFKPAGRGAEQFGNLRCSDVQHRAFLPKILGSAKRHRMRIRVDCSYMPMLAHHRPSHELLAKLCVYGCTGGDFLIGGRANGRVTACSFASAPKNGPRLHELASYWTEEDAFGAFRSWRDAREPCSSCSYHELCRGGCKVVSKHVLGDPRLPDPECPRVIDASQNSRPQDKKTLPVLR